MLTTSPLIGTALLALHLPIAAQVAPATPEIEATAPVTVPAVEVDVAVDDVERALLLLSGYHGIPTAEEFEAALTDPKATMFAILQDPDVSSIHRDRAIGALQYWPGEDVRAFYESMLASPETPEMVRHRVIGHAAVAFGDDAIELITPYLDVDDVQFRLTAVHALGQIGTPAAMQRLDAAAQLEASDVVLRQIQQVGGVR